jgi:3-oxoacid CoA-transferase subunit A
VSGGKLFGSFAQAVADIEDGATLLVGGFGLCGVPEKAIAAVAAKGCRGLTIVSNNCGVDDYGLGVLLANGQIAKFIASYVGDNSALEGLYLSGGLEVELVPQGTLAERMRAAGAGIPGFYTAAGVGTQIAEGKETRAFAGRDYVLEHALGGDFALVKAWRGDAFGNLVYRDTARNFNPLAAMAGRVTIAEVEELVDVGELDPNQIHTPGIYVARILEGSGYEKRIEHRTVSAGAP